MDAALHVLLSVIGLILTFGSKLGLVGIFGLPGAIYFSMALGDRFFRLYVMLTTATVGILIATLLTHLVKSS
jgi:hypothetical protein